MEDPVNDLFYHFPTLPHPFSQLITLYDIVLKVCNQGPQIEGERGREGVYFVIIGEKFCQTQKQGGSTYRRSGKISQ